MNKKTAIFWILSLCIVRGGVAIAEPVVNGFDLSGSRIPVDKIQSGGPPRDGIPSIDNPEFIRPREASYLRADDQLVSVSIGAETRAYPLRILDRHEIVNDRIGDTSFAVTYCPLCATAMVFSREFDGRVLELGVSGLLYQSDVLMYDRQTGSLWSQLGMESVAGPLAGTSLEWMPSKQMTWAEWKKTHPDGRVLSTRTGFKRNYSGTAYEHYRNSPGTMFPVDQNRNELKPKERVAGIILNGQAKAYPLKELAKKPLREDQVGGIVVTIQYNPRAQLVTVREQSTGKAVPVVSAYWFAWQAFYPDTELLP